MPDETASISVLNRLANAIHSLWEVVRDVLHLSAYVAIASLLIYTLWHPTKVGTFVSSMGLQHLEFAGLKVDFNVATAANDASHHGDQILVGLRSINTSNLDEKTREKIESLAKTADDLTGELKTVNATVKKAVETGSGRPAPSQSEAALTGWMFLGRTDEARKRWDTTHETVPMSIGTDTDPDLKPGETVKVITDTYVRADGPDFALSSHRVIGVVPEGATVQIKAYS